MTHLARLSAAVLLLVATGARGADQTGTWTVTGSSGSRACGGGRCVVLGASSFHGRLMLKQDGTYSIPGLDCPRSGTALPDETGTWHVAHKRLVLDPGAMGDVASTLAPCLGVQTIDAASLKRTMRSAKPGSPGCPRRDGGNVCGRITLKGRARFRNRPARFQTVVRFTAERSRDGALCGNGQVDPSEDCDDGNLDDTDTCSSTCRTICRPEPVTSTFAGIQSRIFTGHSCTQLACHGGGSTVGLDLRPGAAYANLVGVASTEVPSQKRVDPGTPEHSLLWRKLAKGTLGGFDDVPQAGMPVGAAPLSRNELEAVRLWIAAGAPADGLVPQTDRLLAGCTAAPPSVDPLPPPAVDQGVQFYAPPWSIPPHGEDEVCYPTYYDFSARIPVDFRVPCPPEWGGAGKECFVYDRTELTQSPNSHHSIIHVYNGQADATDPSFGRYTCHGGALDGTACKPKNIGVAAPDGADCGAGSACAGSVQSMVACIGYGPPDFAVDLAGIGGSQEPHSELAYPAGVYSVLPIRGVVVWNSHAFNVTGERATNEQWFNLYFAGAADRQYPARGLFDISQIFVEDVPAFQKREYCSTDTLPRGARIFGLGSHTHKRGALFRIWGPGVTPCTPGPSCQPEATEPLALTTDYTHPIIHRFDPPLELPGADPASRTFKFCAVYDNGATDPGSVRRASTGIGQGCYDLACIGGPSQAQSCRTNRDCDSRAGVHDGVCDACNVVGGVTTEDEMFIMFGTYYCPEGSDCYSATP